RSLSNRDAMPRARSTGFAAPQARQVHAPATDPFSTRSESLQVFEQLARAIYRQILPPPPVPRESMRPEAVTDDTDACAGGDRSLPVHGRVADEEGLFPGDASLGDQGEQPRRIRLAGQRTVAGDDT